MRFVKHPLNIRVKDKSKMMNEITSDSTCRHGALLPHTICALICGPSNCGKTNVILSLIESQNGVHFENIYVYSKSLQQPKYQYLKSLLSLIEDVGYYTFSNNADIVPIEEALSNSIFIFDDVACDKQDSIREYFSMGRHGNIDSFYLCQTYAIIPKHLIRDNANLIILFKQDTTNLRHVYNDHVNTDMSYEKFNELCGICWETKYGFLVIDKDSPLRDCRYRKGFNCFAIP